MSHFRYFVQIFWHRRKMGHIFWPWISLIWETTSAFSSCLFIKVSDVLTTRKVSRVLFALQTWHYFGVTKLSHLILCELRLLVFLKIQNNTLTMKRKYYVSHSHCCNKNFKFYIFCPKYLASKNIWSHLSTLYFFDLRVLPLFPLWT